ncbi:ankyrin repeats (many copies) domain-containing protein [Ditylenchus destructor]|uniref:Ankyrin repeats (Many copies) domain-containing protein n=1 Tax=Ditylenchus destructor TaxID=166010 RepID=A0AAD4RC53_9BILA|nr:ankyrin repeats (many copies) domain-containing protein [Ditylenchus destructor]
MSSDGTCLVARAVPLPKSILTKEEIENVRNQAIESVTKNLDDLQIANDRKKSPALTPHGESKKPEPGMAPADFVALQSMKSSALARKTNTTSKFTRDCRNLFADLLLSDDQEPAKTVDGAKILRDSKEPVTNVKKVEKCEKEVQPSTNGKENKDGEKPSADSLKKEIEHKEDHKESNNEGSKNNDLLPRGPVRATRTPAGFHPYGAAGGQGVPGYGTAPQTAVYDPSSYNTVPSYSYECGVQSYSYWPHDSRETLSNSSTPDTVNSDLGYSSATSPPQGKHGTLTAASSQEINKLDDLCTNLNTCHLPIPKVDSTELPDALSDFILKYSRRYTPSIDSGLSSSRRTSFSSSDKNSVYGAADSPTTVDSLCNSPLSAASDPSTPPGSAKMHARCSPFSASNIDPQLLMQQKSALKRPAKERLRALINNEDMDEAWAWTCKFIQHFPGALCYQDNDRDTLLHIVVCQPTMDLAKIYALVEQMLKMESEFSHKPFDMPNRLNETPLFLAVEKRHNEVVDYLLEAGASPNAQNSRMERDAPLHYAAARGMVEIVQTLCSYSSTNLNMLNGMGLTPLLCAVKNHGVLEEESQKLIDNKPVIQLLLKYGADPSIMDATNGKSVIIHAVESLNPDIIEIFQSNLSEESMSDLVNKPDLCEETPMRTLQTMSQIDPQIRSKLCLTLITAGATQ